MAINPPGQIGEGILLLGRKESCLYLVKGEGEYALLGGGMAHVLPDVLEQLRTFGIEEQRISRIIILHSHFDHCGLVPCLKERWPWAVITASEKARSLLCQPRVIEMGAAMNQDVLDLYGCWQKVQELGYHFSAIEVEELIRGGDILDCGGLSLEVLDTPGHSSCSVALYLSAEKAMFGSDAAGIPLGEDVLTAANSDFDKYQESLDRMAGYEINIYLAEHFGARIGEEARSFLERSIASARETRAMMEESLARTGNVEASTKAITDTLMEKSPPDFFHRGITETVVRQMLKYLAQS